MQGRMAGMTNAGTTNVGTTNAGTTNAGTMNGRDDELGDDECGDDERQGRRMAGTTQWPHPCYKHETVGRFFFSNSIFFFLILLAIPHCCEHLLAGCVVK